MFFRSRNEKSETIEQTARADPHRFRRDIRETHIFHERRSGARGFQPIRNCRKRVLFGGHELTSRYKLDCKSDDKKRSRAKTPSTQRKTLPISPNLGVLCAFAGNSSSFPKLQVSFANIRCVQ